MRRHPLAATLAAFESTLFQRVPEEGEEPADEAHHTHNDIPQENPKHYTTLFGSSDTRWHIPVLVVGAGIAPIVLIITVVLGRTILIISRFLILRISHIIFVRVLIILAFIPSLLLISRSLILLPLGTSAISGIIHLISV